MTNTISLEDQFLKEGTTWEDWDVMDAGCMMFYNVQLREDIREYLNLDCEASYDILVDTSKSTVEVYSPEESEVVGSVTFKVSVNFK